MSNAQLEGELENEFSDFGLDIDGNISVLEKLCDLCKAHSLTAENIVAQWMSFGVKMKNMQMDISLETLKEFEKKQLAKQDPHKKNKMKTPQHMATVKKFNASIKQDDEEEDDMLEGYSTTPSNRSKITAAKRLQETPEEYPINKRFSSISGEPIPFSPASLASPAMTTPSAKYESRASIGDVVAAFGISQTANMGWKGLAQDRVAIQNFDKSCNSTSQYKYMFQKLQDKANVLNEIINLLSEQMRDALLLDDFVSVGERTQEETVVAGRVCCDSVGRLNSKSVVLEGSRESSSGQRVPLDLSDLSNYSVFPGQIIAVQGKNPSGEKIYANSIYQGNKLPFYGASKQNITIDESQFTVYVCCGPYATYEGSLSYTPLQDMMNVVKKESPDVLIMLGPFVDAKQPCISKCEIDKDFTELFYECYNIIQHQVQGLNTQVVLIPSQRDAFHDQVYPQPPYQLQNTNPQIHLMSDPCTLRINDVIFGMTSTDVLFHMGAEEVSSFTVRSDRLGRLVDHLVMQQCYYPLHPCSEDVNMEYEKFEEHAFMPITPDVLLVPSDLRYFIKEAKGCLAVNPGRLVKGQTGGTFSKLLLKPKKPTDADKSSVIGTSIAQVVRL